ncbi:hypothetical protein BTHER_07121 [Brochothrix thermosphacta DSM 20171 = FSL F6-1036]|nr:hypothetical protein BTHER_07121 [Brochothrix thermosphacta DSM 20171 = FSL F6-1036]
MTPMEAMMSLYDIQKDLKSKKIIRISNQFLRDLSAGFLL